MVLPRRQLDEAIREQQREMDFVIATSSPFDVAMLVQVPQMKAQLMQAVQFLNGARRQVHQRAHGLERRLETEEKMKEHDGATPNSTKFLRK